MTHSSLGNEQRIWGHQQRANRHLPAVLKRGMKWTNSTCKINKDKKRNVRTAWFGWSFSASYASVCFYFNADLILVGTVYVWCIQLVLLMTLGYVDFDHRDDILWFRLFCIRFYRGGSRENLNEIFWIKG